VSALLKELAQPPLVLGFAGLLACLSAEASTLLAVEKRSDSIGNLCHHPS
jgi:hypothetical protein